jgi:hypothetical protein
MQALLSYIRSKAGRLFCSKGNMPMNSFDVGTLLSFFFDPSVGCCCCIPIIGFVTTVAGIVHASKMNRTRFEAHMSRLAGRHAVAAESH